jgi:hypothetical protein
LPKARALTGSGVKQPFIREKLPGTGMAQETSEMQGFKPAYDVPIALLAVFATVSLFIPAFDKVAVLIRLFSICALLILFLLRTGYKGIK